MVINKFEHAEAINTLVSFLSDEQKNDPRVKSFLDKLQLTAGPHYEVVSMHYVEDGIYNTDQDPIEFATRDDVMEYFKENDITEYYDDEKQVYVENGEEFPENYEAEAEGWRLDFIS